MWKTTEELLARLRDDPDVSSATYDLLVWLATRQLASIEDIARMMDAVDADFIGMQLEQYHDDPEVLRMVYERYEARFQRTDAERSLRGITEMDGE